MAERIVEDSSHAASKIVRKETVFEVSHPFTKILVCLLPQLNSRCIHEEVSAHAVSLLQLLQSIAKNDDVENVSLFELEGARDREDMNDALAEWLRR